MNNHLDVIVISPAGEVEAAIAIAGSRSGALGILNLEFGDEHVAAFRELGRLESLAHAAYGVLIDALDEPLLDAILKEKHPGLQYVLTSLHGVEASKWPVLAHSIQSTGARAYAVITSVAQAAAAEQAGFDGLIAKGSESGGWIGEETAFILMQHLQARTTLPVWLQGGIGLHTAAAGIAGGAAGVVLDAQLLLTREAAPTQTFRSRLENFDGSETQVSGASQGAAFRSYSRQGTMAIDELQRLEAGISSSSATPDEVRSKWMEAVRERAGHGADTLWAIGQDAASAAPLAKRYVTVGGIVAGIRDSIKQHLQLAKELRPLAEGSLLAQAHSTRYPIVQGPMTRVSDRAEFADAVASGGGLPFLALALMREDEVTPLLAQTRRYLATRAGASASWASCRRSCAKNNSSRSWPASPLSS